MSETLYIATAVANPLHWGSRISLAKTAVASWLKEPNTVVYLTECLYGSNTNYLLAGLGPSDRYIHVPVRATTTAWTKENLLNIAIAKIPSIAQKISVFDADVTFRSPGWATRISHALDLYPVIQPWTQALDLGPQDQIMATHTSFANLWHLGKPAEAGEKLWVGSNYTYAHPGYAWAFQRSALDDIGGLYEEAAMGSADRVMALAFIGKWRAAIPKGMSDAYYDSVAAWSKRAYKHIDGKLGYTIDVLEHPFHGLKTKRFYSNRPEMFAKAGFDPSRDLKKNSYGVVEFSSNKRWLELQWLNYLRSRDEDLNSLT